MPPASPSPAIVDQLGGGDPVVVMSTHGTRDTAANGRLHRIGIGRHNATTPVRVLIAERDIRIIATATGELLRQLELDPTRAYPPTENPRNTRP